MPTQPPTASTRRISREEFSKVPYIDNVPTDGRTVFLAPYLDRTDGKWKIQIPQGNELKWAFAEPDEACYYAESVADQSTDMYLEIMDVVARLYSFDSVLRTSLELLKRIVNCAVVLEKYFFCLNQFRNTKNLHLASMVQTDLEFLFGDVRIAYDLMQIILNELWIKTRRPSRLRDSFTSMVQMSPNDLRRRYNLPEPMITFYSTARDFFLRARGIRDQIYHYEPGSGEIGSVLLCDTDGFALPRDSLFPDMMSSAFDIWPTNKIKPNGLVSVLALIAYVCKNTLRATEDFSGALTESINPLETLSESHKVFFRSPYVPHLLKLDKYLSEQWIGREFSYNLF